MPLPHVTDHAVLRYMERVMGLDVEAVRRRIADTCRDIGSATSLKKDGFRYEIRRDRGYLSITTVAPVGDYISRTRRRQCAEGGR